MTWMQSLRRRVGSAECCVDAESELRDAKSALHRGSCDPDFEPSGSRFVQGPSQRTATYLRDQDRTLWLPKSRAQRRFSLRLLLQQQNDAKKLEIQKLRSKKHIYRLEQINFALNPTSHTAAAKDPKATNPEHLKCALPRQNTYA